MRKDVKLGFAIGGVLLAVAIVFALVNSSRVKVKDEAIDDSPSSQTDTTVADAGKTDANKAVEVKGDAHAAAPAKTETGSTGTTPSDGTATKVELKSTAQADATSDSHDVFKNTGSTNWEQTFKTGTPILAATSGASVTDAPTPEVTPGHTGPVSTGAAGFNYMNHKQQGDADVAVAAGNTVTAGNTVGTPVRPSLTSADSPRTATTHAIKSGETFSTIAAAYYGNAKYHKLISAANPKLDSSHLKIGQVITLPAFDPKSEAKATAAAATPAVAVKAIDSRTQYRVQQGDNLHRICMKLYGDPKNVDVIYNLNKAAIGSDPAKLKLGMILTLPAAPTAATR